MNDFSDSPQDRASDASDFPSEGKLLGIDFGTKRIGFAISTPEQSMSVPLENYDRRNPRLDTKHIKELAEEYRIKGLVIGLPVHMSGDEGGMARQARDFGEELSKETSLPVRYWDERFTSAMAEEILQAASLTKKQRKARKDKLAAHMLLQSFLDALDREQKPQAMD